MRKNWWKILAFLILLYTVIGGFLLDVPARHILNETIRNLYFHVCMWMAMMVMFFISFVHSIKYLSKGRPHSDMAASSYAGMGAWLGLLGYSTGFIWANYTWLSDQDQSLANILKEPKLIGAAIGLLIYGAYFVLRSSFTDQDKRGRVSAVYNIFAFAMLFPTMFIIPRMVDSLHPGGENGNPALNFRDTDMRLKAVFYPAVIGWSLLAAWIATLRLRVQLLKENSTFHA